MSIPKENRQQMINLMYLVLTALLALNVSAEILNAFKTISNSLDASNKIIDENTNAVFGSFALKKAKEPQNQNLIKYEALASQVITDSKTLLEAVANLKADIVKEAGGPGTEGGIMEKPDDLDVSERFIIDEKRGDKLKQQIDAYRQKMLGIIPDEADKKLYGNKIITTETKNSEGWVRENFGHMPAVASYTMLTKLESDIKNTEGQIVSYLYGKIGSIDIPREAVVLDQFSAQVASPSAYILQGETFEANVFLAASSSEQSVSVSVNGSSLPVKDGVGTFKASGNGIGEHSLTGVVSVKNNRTGEVKQYKTPEFKYTVAAPFATVSPTKMNVFYIGVDNPVQVSADGTAASKLNVSMDGGSISGSGGNYTVRVTTQGMANVNVVANGKNYGKFPFRVKMIPNPIAKIGGQAGGRMPAAVFKAQTGLAAVLENFDFDAKFDVLSYQMFYAPKLKEPQLLQNSGAYFGGALKPIIMSAKPGDIFYFEEIKVKGPDGTTRKIQGITFKID